jgi:phage head-tail adaptor, putative, SPP1 family
MADLNILISDLRTRITFQSPTISKDPGGAQVASYANIGTVPTVWAQWINDHGQESVQGGADVSVQRATVRIRHRSDIVETWRVLKDGESWQILSIDPVQDANRWVELRVERVKATV